MRSSSAGVWIGDELRTPASTGVHADLPVGQVGRFAGCLLLLGRRDDDDRRGDAEGEGDGGERRPGAGLVAGEVSQRQARGDRRCARRARRRGGSPADPGAGVPRIVATIPATISGGLSRSESARPPMPAAISAAATIAEWRAGLGLGGRAESASVTGRRATVRPGHQAAAVAPRTATRTVSASSAQGRLSRSMRWSTADSSVGANATQSARPDDRPDQRADRADDRAVGQQHEAEVLLGRADRGEHAELAEPSLRDDGEACGGDQRGQEQEDGGHGEHRQRVGRPVVAAPRSSPAKADRSLGRGACDEGVDRAGRSRRPGP